VLKIANLGRVLALLALGQVALATAAAETTAVETAAVSSPEQIITASCSGCHLPDGEGRWFRLSDQRKTPEGWQMTLVRMQLAHQVKFVDPAGGDSQAAMRSLVKYLADTQGLAPAESAPYRYILEQELDTVEVHDTEQFRTMCARCHSGARVALQRRTEDEWRNLVHFHLGQFPTTEYQMMGRDRDWLGIALEEALPYLAETYPMQTAAWEQWQAVPRVNYQGRWRIAGTMPGRGDFSGEMTAVDKGGDQYALEFSGQFDDGEALAGSGSAIVYTGYEWRATLKLGGTSYRQVLAAEAQGAELVGRMYQRDQEEWGLRMRAVRDNGQALVIAVQPPYLQVGSEGVLRVVGLNLDGPIDLGPGLEVVETLAGEDADIMVKVVASGDAAEGARDIRVGDATLPDAITVFRSIDHLVVEPAFAIGRVGGNGGSEAVEEAIFDAVAYSAGPDAEIGTADDLRIGRVPANWTVEPWNEQAVLDQDLSFAGKMDKDSGVFTPAGAGPNPERKYQTNNAGNLKVVATVQQGGKTLQGDGHLIVTVQRWNNPPIR
jgi:quinohemoprotein amine dehydrogenase